MDPAERSDAQEVGPQRAGGHPLIWGLHSSATPACRPTWTQSSHPRPPLLAPACPQALEGLNQLVCLQLGAYVTDRYATHVGCLQASCMRLATSPPAMHWPYRTSWALLPCPPRWRGGCCVWRPDGTSSQRPSSTKGAGQLR